MNAFLMHRDRNFEWDAVLPPNAADLIQDLELNTLFDGMSAGDAFLLEVARKAVLASLREPGAILHRQQILADCLQRGEILREMYRIASEAVEHERAVPGALFGLFARSPLLYRSLQVLHLFLDLLKKLRRLADEHGAQFRSEGFSRFLAMLGRELDDEYLAIFEEHLRQLEFEHGVVISAELGEGNKGTHYTLRKPPDKRESWAGRWLRNWMERLSLKDSSSFVYEVPNDDEGGLRALAELRGQGITSVAIALAQSADHLLSFFSMLRSELGFYVGCLNLHQRLVGKGEPICFPEPVAAGQAAFSCRGLYDVCLSLTLDDRAVGSDVTGDGKCLVMITGANRGGKSTFLRGVGLAQLMMQSGLFVPAGSFRSNVCDLVFTHFKREEDAGMKSGKLDEELARMSSIIDHATPNSLILLNESFASTNEREGSEIARQIVRALLESGMKIFYVTHMFHLADGFYAAKMDTAMFLRAERLSDGRRTFRLVEGEPLPTSYGEDLYRRIFEGVPQAFLPV